VNVINIICWNYQSGTLSVFSGCCESGWSIWLYRRNRHGTNPP